MSGQRVKQPMMLLLILHGKSRCTAVRPWLSSRILTKRIERKPSKRNGKLMNQVVLTRQESLDRNSYCERNKNLEKSLLRKKWKF